jgi:hypothetical protein
MGRALLIGLSRLFSPAHNTRELIAYLIAALLLSALALALMHKGLGWREKRRLTMAVTFLAGLFFALEYYYPVRMVAGKERNFLTDYIQPANEALAVILTFTVGLGIYSLIQVHGRNVLRQRRGWYNSLAFFVAMVVMFGFTLADNYIKVKEPAPSVLPYPKAIFEILFNGMYNPLQSATFSLLAFYIASAAYRAFRVRTLEAGLMMAAAFIVMLGQVPIGAWLTHALPTSGFAGVPSFFRLENRGNWVMSWLNTPAQRGITFGVAIGMLAMSLRIWLSLERGTFFSEQS